MAISLRRALISSRNLFYALRTASIHSCPNFSHLNSSAAAERYSGFAKGSQGQQLKEKGEADTFSGSNYMARMRSADKLNSESVELEKLVTKRASPAEKEEETEEKEEEEEPYLCEEWENFDEEHESEEEVPYLFEQLENCDNFVEELDSEEEEREEEKRYIEELFLKEKRDDLEDRTLHFNDDIVRVDQAGVRMCTALRHLRYELNTWEEWLSTDGSRIEWNSDWMLLHALPAVRKMSAESTEYAKENIKQARQNAILNFEFRCIYGGDVIKKQLMAMLDRKVEWALEEAEKMDAGFRTFMSDCAKTAKYLKFIST